MKLYLEVNIGTPEAPDWRRIPDVPHALIRPAMEETSDTAPVQPRRSTDDDNHARLVRRCRSAVPKPGGLQ